MSESDGLLLEEVGPYYDSHLVVDQAVDES